MKKYIKIAQAAMMAIMAVALLSGCTSSSGRDLAQALAKQADYKSYNSNSEVKVNVKLNNFPDDGNVQLMGDLLSNISINTTGTYSSPASQKAAGTLKWNGLSADFEAYSKDDTLWFKYPLLSKYLHIDLMKLNGFDSKEKYMQYQEKLPALASDFAKKFILDYNFGLKNIKSNGTVSIETLDGTKSAREIELNLSDSDFKEFLEYGLTELFGSEDFRSFIINVVELVDEKAVDDELKQEIVEALDTMRDGVDGGFDNAMQYVELDKEGFKAKFYIDNSGNIIRNDMNLTLRITAPDSGLTSLEYDSENSQSVDIRLSLKNDFWDINKNLQITYPEFDDTNVIKIEDYGNSSLSIKNMLESYREQKKSELISRFYLDMTFAQVRGSYEMLNQPCYFEKNSFYVPARNIADALGVKLKYDGKSVTFYDAEQSLILYVNSSKANLNGRQVKNNLVSKVKEGTAMVPLRLVSEAFGAKIKWDEFSEAVIVEAQK